jgi:hypothetical protein
MSYNPSKSARAGGPAAVEESVCVADDPPVEQAPAPLPQPSAPRALQAHERTALRQGHTPANQGEAFLRPCVPRATARLCPAA